MFSSELKKIKENRKKNRSMLILDIKLNIQKNEKDSF